MSIVGAVSELVKSVSIWLNPERKEKIILREAIEAAEQLLLILRKQGRYQFFNEKKLREHEEHYQKRFDSWKDGAS